MTIKIMYILVLICGYIVDFILFLQPIET